MATYIISDIHGQYDMFTELLEKIGFSQEDKLFILGDIIDRGPGPIRTMQKIMGMPNVSCIKGNHEVMAQDCLEYYIKEDHDHPFLAMEEDLLNKILLWKRNGCNTTLDEFFQLSSKEKKSIVGFIRNMPTYQRVSVSGKEYLLVHGGLGGFSPEKQMEEYSLNELVWERPDYSFQYYPDVYVVTGHTPTQIISINPNPGYIFKCNNNIAIDCGCCLEGGRLAAIRLEDGQEFYSDKS